jgi:hypothetical protein
MCECLCVYVWCACVTQLYEYFETMRSIRTLGGMVHAFRMLALALGLYSNPNLLRNGNSAPVETETVATGRYRMALGE